MNKWLVIVLGQQFIKPMSVYGKMAMELLIEQSKNTTYKYVLFVHNDRYDIYVPQCVIHLGNVEELSNNVIQGLRIR